MSVTGVKDFDIIKLCQERHIDVICLLCRIFTLLFTYFRQYHQWYIIYIIALHYSTGPHRIKINKYSYFTITTLET